MGSMIMSKSDVAAVLDYHRSSSLDPDRRSALPEKLERRTQPIPFRRYEGAPRLLLPVPSVTDEPASSGASPSLADFGRLFGASLALTGWKRTANARFGLRAVPSAGNLHPLESYLLTSDLEPLPADAAAALYHYSPFDHALERRCWLGPEVWASLRSACPRASFFVALTVIYWRCGWKYGKRAFRLCQLDAGHAVAALDAAAALEDRRARFVDADDDALESLLGVSGVAGSEAEKAVCLLALEPRGGSRAELSWRAPAAMIGSSPEAFAGVPSRISEHHRRWPGLEATVRATRRRLEVSAPPKTFGVTEPVGTAPASFRLATLLERRSRSVFNDQPMDRALFESALSRVFGGGAASSFPWTGDLTHLLFVHRVESLEPGLYLVRDTPSPAEPLRSALRRDFEWHKLDETKGESGLIRLSRGDARRAVSFLSGHQSAAGGGAFTVLFLAPIAPLLQERGAFAYRRLHWQAGELGHRLYLEAEAKGLGATGLGGFYDDRLCALLGLEDDSYKPLYLLAVGHRGGEDPPLEPPYAHRDLGAVPVPASRGGWRKRTE